MSGFYTEDMDAILEVSLANSLDFISTREKNNWISVIMEKNFSD